MFSSSRSLLSVAGLAIIIERTLALRRKRVISDTLGGRFTHFSQATTSATLRSTVVAGACWDRSFKRPCRISIRQVSNIDAIQVRAQSVGSKEGWDPGIIVGVAPLQALGTVSGLPSACLACLEAGRILTEAIHIAAGISEALNMVGLVMAIPALIIHAITPKEWCITCRRWKAFASICLQNSIGGRNHCAGQASQSPDLLAQRRKGARRRKFRQG